MKDLTIGQVANAAGVNVETIRFYERREIVKQPERPPSGFRRYPPETIARVRFVRRAKDLGFSLREITELLDLRVDPHVTCEDVRVSAVCDVDTGHRIRAKAEVDRAYGKSLSRQESLPA